jgi:hypothetical protein
MKIFQHDFDIHMSLIARRKRGSEIRRRMFSAKNKQFLQETFYFFLIYVLTFERKKLRV